MTGRSRLADAAHRYADVGWPVFPCQPGAKLPATEHGFLDATTSHHQISSWWSRHPDANVAIATGQPGPDVLDVDVKAGRSGFTALNETKRAGLVEGARAMIRTPSGGAHLYYKGTAQRSGSIPGCALDFRAGGGYVVAPPSKSAETGRRYEVMSHAVSDKTVDWDAIRGLLASQAGLCTGRRPQLLPDGQRQTGHLAAWLAVQEEGNRNNALFWAATRACEAGDYDALTAIAQAARDGRLNEREIAATVRSARRTAGRPFEPARDREAG